jgi:hypothetical protein
LLPYGSITYWILSGFPFDRYTKLVHRRSGRRAPTTPHPEAWLPLIPAGEGPHRSAISSRAKREIRKGLETSDAREALQRVYKASVEAESATPGTCPWAPTRGRSPTRSWRRPVGKR